MKGEERIRHYFDRAFYGVDETQEIREEKEALCEELLEKYKKLIQQGYEPEAAYQSVISGIGDIFELVDGIVETTKQKKNETNAEHSEGEKDTGEKVSNREKSDLPLKEAAPYLAAGILFLLWIGNRLFPVGPKEQEAFALLILGIAAGGAVVWGILRYSVSGRKEGVPKHYIIIGILWCIAGIIFLRSAMKPHLRECLWLIPIAALAIHQLILAVMDYKDIEKKGGHT